MKIFTALAFAIMLLELKKLNKMPKKDISELVAKFGLEPLQIIPNPIYEAQVGDFIRKLVDLYRRSRENPSPVKYSI